jgi:mannose-6-phosphate isomerase
LALYPLLLEPIYKEKVWGGRALDRFRRPLPGGADTSIGESWELASLDATSPTGGGGEGAHSRICNGPLIKRGLDDVVSEFGALVTGRLALSPEGRFPLLVKYLDARENVSVQVHPSPEYALHNPEAHLKSEAWYIVDAADDAVIYKGVVEGTSREQFRAAIEDGTVADLLIRVPARIGECHYLPSGTCHALGAGILVAEVQTPADTTFRVFDWGRTDRELHVAAALESIDLGPVSTAENEPGTSVEVDGAVGRQLVSCEHFTIDEWVLQPDAHRRFDFDLPVVLMLVDGSGRLAWGDEPSRDVRCEAGRTVLLPSALSSADFHADADATILEVRFPDPSDQSEADHVSRSTAG